MAPTKANARYAVTTLSLPTKVMGNAPWFTSLPALTNKVTNRSRWKKSALLSLAPATWLKNSEINALKSP